MPIPKPSDGESHEDFMGRCMANPTMNSEFPDSGQRNAVCQSAWESKDMAGIQEPTDITEPKTMKRVSYTCKADSIDREERTMVVKISTDTADRDSEVILPKGIALENFKKNPVVLWSHDHGGFGGSPGESVIGKALWIKKQVDGVVAKVQFAAHEAAQRVFDLFAGGFLNAWSIGFIPGASHEPTKNELEKRPDWQGVRRIFDETERVNSFHTFLSRNNLRLKKRGELGENMLYSF